MSGVVVPADHSDLAEVVSRAMALLSQGDVLAAKLLAARAYDDAKSAVRLAERFGAAESLTAKARQLQGDALLIETRAKIAIADEWDEAKAAGLVLAGRPKSVPDGNAFTAQEAGLTRKEIHEARKLRDAERAAPGIVERAIAARLAGGFSPSRAQVRGIGTRSATQEERGADFYATPPQAVHALLALEGFATTIWEPACGDGAISRLLEQAGHDVVLSDLVDRGAVTRDGECARLQDFLATRRAPDTAPDIVTNPPFNIANAFIAHALREHKPRKMAMLLNLNFLCGFDDPDRVFCMEECPPARVLVFTRRLPMMHRDGWDGPKAGSQMNTAWFVWERKGDGRYGDRTQLKRVDWKQHEPA